LAERVQRPSLRSCSTLMPTGQGVDVLGDALGAQTKHDLNVL
jgi:hypothetical protein